MCDAPPLPGNPMEECSAPSGEPPQCYTPPCTKMEAQLTPPGSDAYAKQCAAPETPMCRICHDGGAQEELLSPCECSGTLAPIHRSCLEHWLSASRTSFCELCHYQFTVQRRSRPVLEWLQNPSHRREKRTLFGDMACFLLITPLATISGWLCLRGAIDHLHFSSRLEAVGLIALTVALFTIYLFWTLVSLRYHCRLYNGWRRSNQRVVLLLPRSHGNAPAAPQRGKQPVVV
ncbi:E3 ubiquitin-protein ligase MARCH3-like [Cyclopterus lumpus]|uniref:E3 ubiquitin-protein ligase MARCH3-like n=1 Tax=Cyclopterus lumpus TaxID=8103 RepID=UPI00148682F3|nr:E3 ubiquitin-protein ligase MARCH3-like [Cyclopterus lumpus]XP_034402189.1 E3 ubiquitin-protein ligase MARCH3-like [Cyclopterus lumpus]